MRLTAFRIAASLCVGFGVAAPCDADDAPWPRYAIDASSRGADGVRLADVDGDGRLDVVTGWEEGGVIRICRQPATRSVKTPWPAVTIGNVKSPEDAVLVDLDRDGTMDVVSCCEGKTRSVFVHWAPGDQSRYWDESTWSTKIVPAAESQQAWMFCLPGNSSQKVVELFVGSKGSGATISRLATIGAPRRVDQWTLQPLCQAGWIMSLRSLDMDADGDLDVLYSDRKGPSRGVAWLERPQNADRSPWTRHAIGGMSEEVMFLDAGDLTGDGRAEIVAATRSAGILIFRRDRGAERWRESMIPMPTGCGTGKGVRIADMDADGRADVVVSCENSGGKHGVFWLSRLSDLIAGTWEFHPISGILEGIKFDRMELLDLDADGDLDVMTCEERDNLGVIWYANPAR